MKMHSLFVHILKYWLLPVAYYTLYGRQGFSWSDLLIVTNFMSFTLENRKTKKVMRVSLWKWQMPVQQKPKDTRLSLFMQRVCP